MRTAKLNRKYRLHVKLKKAGIRYSPVCRTIYVPWNCEELIEDIKELERDYNYQIQTELV